MNREMRDWLKIHEQMKGEPQPTPGPWKLDASGYLVVTVNEPHVVVAILGDGVAPLSPVEQASGRLIASAPTLAAEVATFKALVESMQSLCNAASIWQTSYASDRLDNEYFQENDAIEAKLAEAVLAYRKTLGETK